LVYPGFEGDVAEIWDFERSVENRYSIGGTSRKTVLQQIQDLKTWLKESH